MSNGKKKTRKEAIQILINKGEPIEPNAYCESLIQAEMRGELKELLNDTEYYPW